MRQDSRNIAVVLTAICAVLAVGLVGLTIGSEGQGATALWLMLPMIAVVAAHIFMGPAAMILALLSRRLWVNLVVFGYFIGGTWSLWVFLHGGSPPQVLESQITESWSTFVEAREFPAETELCQSLALRMNEGGRGQAGLEPYSLPASPDLDVNFLCRHRTVRLPRHLRHDFYRSTPLQLAALGLEVELIDALIERGAEADRPTAGALTPLLLVLSNGTGFSVHGSMNQQAHSGRIRRAAAALLTAGANVAARDSYGAGVLHWASGAGDPELVRLLLRSGAEVSAEHGPQNGTPAHYAIKTVQELQRRLHGYKTLPQAEYDARFAAQKAILEQLIAAGATPVAVIAAAVDFNAPWAIELLRSAGIAVAELLTRNGPGFLRHGLRNHHRELVEYLIAAGINVNSPTERGDRLITEFLRDRQDWQLRTLIAAGADVNVADKRGKTALEIAVENGNADAVRVLLDSGAEVSKRAVRTATPEIRQILQREPSPAELPNS